MDLHTAVSGLAELHAASLGDPEIRIAVLDGPVDLSHPCFEGASMRQFDTLVRSDEQNGPMARHGTHVASLLFGQPGSPVTGVAPRCTGLILPVFSDERQGHLAQLDLARAVEHALQEGAHVINISGGERSSSGEGDALLERALQRCVDNNVLVVAAAGNDGCACLHVPAASPSVLAVGALGLAGTPLEDSNWGDAYRTNGVLAPGEALTGAIPDGQTAEMTGTSFATPVVSGVAALLLSLQHRSGNTINPRAAAEAILATATPCHPRDGPECSRFVTGVINIAQARSYMEEGGTTKVAEHDVVQVSESAPESAGEHVEVGAPAASPAAVIPAGTSPPPADPPPHREAPAHSSAGVKASADEDCGCGGSRREGVKTSASNTMMSYVYALGSVGFDFGTEARRDTFRQLMPDVQRTDPRTEGEGESATPIFVSPNPYDVFQLYDYLESRPSESTKLIWTLNLDLTPIYAVEAEIGYPEDVYKPLRDALRFQALPDDDNDYVARVSIPGVLTDRTVQLFSGQVVPIVVAQPRGLYMWNETLLVNSVLEAVRGNVSTMDETYVSQLVRTFLDKVYFQCRNLGRDPADRALNFAATNAYQFASGIANGLLSGRLVPGAEEELYTLDTIDVSRSPYCRMDSDCWDVRITFFDPVNDRRAKSVYQFTIDVSDSLPVSLAPAHQYLAT